MKNLIKKINRLQIRHLIRPFETKRAKSFLRWLLGVATCILFILIACIGNKPASYNYREGDIAREDITADRDLKIDVVDMDNTELLRREAEDRVIDVYDIDAEVIEDGEARITLLFEKLSELKGAGLSDSERALKQKEILSGWKISAQGITQLSLQEDINDVGKGVKEIFVKLMQEGVVATVDKDALMERGKDAIILRNPKTGPGEKKGYVVTLKTTDDVKRLVHDSAAIVFQENRKVRSAVSEVVEALIVPSIRDNPAVTGKRKEEARNSVPLQHKSVEIKKGELITARHQRITKAHMDYINLLQRAHSAQNRFFLSVGVSLAVIGLITIAVLYLYLLDHEVFSNTKKLLLISAVSSYVFLISKIINVWAYADVLYYIVPVAAGSMLLSILLSSRIAIIITVFLSIFTGIVFKNNFGIMMMSLTGGMVGVYSVIHIRRRSQFLTAGFLVGITNLITILSLRLLDNTHPAIYIVQCAWGFMGGIISCLIVMGSLPLLEHLFNMVTNISLLELLDLNHPLLKSMALKAQGTYHHSLVVSNLAEAGCEAIGANNLLAKVGCYFHDIGKIEKAEYFSENEMGAKSRHDKLNPTMSRLIILNHVKNGVELARKYKLKRAIIDFISQHHGTSLVYYFFQRALEKSGDMDEISEEGFRYPGPKPLTKEAAIVMLADSIEAASRSLTFPTTSRIKGLIHEVINDKFIDGQLDACELTLHNLTQIADAFTRVVTGMFHSRVKYPEKEENRFTKGYDGYTGPELAELHKVKFRKDKKNGRKIIEI